MSNRVRFGLVLCALLAAAAVAGAQPSAAELAAFFDAEVPALMEKFHVVGAVVGAADRSEVLFLRGYGSADLERGIAVDPQNTAFMAGSIAKLFTWTALMQLQEQGKLALEDPVQKHLDFALPDNFSEPIRVVDLMNHTPGFEDRLIGLFVQDPALLQPLRETVSRHIPRRVRPPGQESSYSNYGAMLAGYIVQRLSGEPYEQYVERHIFQPLGMSHSTFRQPVPPPLSARLAVPYALVGGKPVPQKLEILNGAPAGALVTTAPDLLRFYQAYLNGGQLEGRRILQEKTVSKMQETTFRHDPRAAGFAHGFFELWRGERLGFGHGGDTMYFHSESGYLPGENLAFFVSTNTASGMQLTMKLLDLTLDRFFPSPRGRELAAQAGLRPDLREYTGVFAMNRRSESDPTQIMSALSLVRPKAVDGGLRVVSILDPDGGLYVPVAPDIFQQENGGLRFVFLRDERGRVRSVYSHDFPAFLFSRPPWFESPLLSAGVVALALLLLASAAIAPPTGLLALIPRLRSRGAGPLRAAALWVGRAYLLLILAQVIVVASLGNFIFVPIGPVHVIPLYLAAIAAAGLLALLVPVWRAKLFRPVGRIHYTLFAAAQALFMVWLGHWGFFFV